MDSNYYSLFNSCHHGDFCFDLFDPTMDSPDQDACCDHGDLGFAFNDSNFSDRVLRIYILSEEAITSVLRVKTLYISSLILAEKSAFFYKLFKNGMIETAQHDVTLQINASEEYAFMELLKFMYNINPKIKTASDVLDVLIAADKFDVASCVRYCGSLLRNLPMTPEIVLVYLDLPSTILMSKAFHPLTVAAKQFYAVHYKDITKYEDEIINLPLASVEAIISSDDLHVNSEDAVYKFVLKWARAQYPELQERCEIIMTRLAKLIRYPYMSYKWLTESVLHCIEFEPDFTAKVVSEAVSFKAELSHKQHTYISDKNSNFNHHRFVERAYAYRPIKLVEFKEPHPHLVVYMDIKHDVCARLFPSDSVHSQQFVLAGQVFNLSANCSKTVDILEERSFRIFLGVHQKDVAVSFTVNYELAVRSRSMPSEEFVTICKGNCTFTVKNTWVATSLFVIPWRLFIGKDSIYFIDDVLHLSAKLSVKELVKY